MGIIKELQNEAINNNEIGNLIRKAYFVAKKLNLNDFEMWLHNELNGYKNLDDVPNYRNVSGKLLAWNPVRGWIPCLLNDTRFYDLLTKRKIPDNIIHIEYLKKNNKEVNIALPNEIRKTLSKLAGFDTEYTVSCDVSYMDNIIQSVKNEILDWALKLEKLGVEGENMTFTEKEKQIVKGNHTTNYFSGNVENLMLQQNTKNSSQTQDVLTTNNKVFEQLREVAETLPEEDKQKIINSIDEMQKNIGEKSFSQKYNDFIQNAANHMTVFTPLIPILTPMLSNLMK